MSIIGNGNGFTIWSSAGEDIVEGTVASGSDGAGRTITFVIQQYPVQYRTVYVQVVPITGQTGDFWDSFWSNRVGGEPADQFALSSFVGVEPNGYFSVTLNADAIQEDDEIFEIRVYENNLDAARGYAPLSTGRFTVVDDDIFGTAGADHLQGRDHAESMYGGAGADRLDGAGGADTLNGGLGADTLNGGAGDDIYIVDNVGDQVNEGHNGGTDLVRTSISYALTANVENLTLTGTGNINGTGNGLANRINGNAGNNLLDGGLGADTLNGGAGDDIYIVDNVGDQVNEGRNGGTDLVRASVSYALTANVENLTLTGTGNINGTGNDLANRIN
ncbi:hypothetical protein GI374_18690, partial [Paracoccus sp. S-4012]|uniref:calcium-binding protein n=1 Tax=Paracoccus sp. S-4012 TaxID=2665648 RepID=UPI00132A27A6